VWTQPTGINAYVYGDADSTLGAIDESFRTMRGWWFPDRRPATYAYEGAKVEGDRAFDIVRITPEGGRPFALWIDRATHLIDRDIEQQVASTTLPNMLFPRNGDCLIYCINDDLRPVKLNVVTCVRHNDVNSSR
jgi:hypothetical protein